MARNGKRLGFLPRWRVFTYVILIINVIGVLCVAGVASLGNSPQNCGTSDGKTCQGVAVELAILVALFLIFIDLILGLLWLITRHFVKRPCAVCGAKNRKTAVVCHNCGRDPRTPPPPAWAPGGYYPPPPGPPGTFGTPPH